MINDFIHPIEREIVEAIVQKAINMNLYVSIDNGGDKFELDYSNSFTSIMNEIGQAEEDLLFFYKQINDNSPIGTISLVYGNEPNYVISNYSVNKIINEIIEHVQPIVDKYDTLESAWEVIGDLKRKIRSLQ